jgi:methyl coenzyme M reductase beta subunit
MLQTAIIIGLEVKVYLMHLSDVNILESSPKSTDAIDFQAAKIISVYHLVFITAQVFQLLLCLDAVFRQDTIQIIGLAVFNFLLLLYSVVQHIQTNNAIGSLVDALHLNESTASGLRGSTDFEITVIAILAFFSFTFAFQAWHLFQEFGWKIYKKIGADLNMRRK